MDITLDCNSSVNHLAALPSDSNEHRFQQVMNRKRLQRTSPPSPQLRSPLKKCKRMRTGTEQGAHRVSAINPTIFTTKSATATLNRMGMTLADFVISTVENEEYWEFTQELNLYMMFKSCTQETLPDKTFLGIQDYLSLRRATHTQKSNVQFHCIMDAVADNKDTMMAMLDDLHQRYIVEKKLQYLIVEGDAKLYEILQSLKHEYGATLEWVIPFPGDWHTLKNYQIALMKVYYDAGLKNIAHASGYPTNQIKTCGQFKRTHQFLMEVWEAIYRTMIECYVQQAISTTGSEFRNKVIKSLENVRAGNDFNTSFNTAVNELQADSKVFMTGFTQFVQQMVSKDDVWKFWTQFAFQDVMAYVTLFLAMRSGDWNIRVCSIKKMAALFTAFDHKTYQKLLAQHIADIHNMPPTVLTMLQHGGWVVSVTGRPWHSVGVDEAHEMLINRQCKASVTKPSADYMHRMATYLTHRSKVLENIKQQLLPEMFNKKSDKTVSPFSASKSDYILEKNIRDQIQIIKESHMFEKIVGNRGLQNLFTRKHATPEQSHDLLSFRGIGQCEFMLYVSFHILNKPSTQAPNRRHCLQTFSDKKRIGKKLTQAEKDRRLLVSAMKKKIEHSQKTGKPIEQPGEQLLDKPMSLCDSEGNPLKGQKSYTTKYLEKRYQNAIPQVFSADFPDWENFCTIIDGMFMINTNPLGIHKTFSDYAKFLIQRHIMPQFYKGSSEVHVLFDTPGRLPNTPKYFEQKRRDEQAEVSEQHYCDDINGSTRIPTRKWHNGLLNCRDCKRKLVNFLGDYFLSNIHLYLTPNQKFYVAGAFKDTRIDTAWYVSAQKKAQPDPTFFCKAEEADTRIWLHTKQTYCEKVLILSADTDTYHIGCALKTATSKDIIIQLNKISSRELKYLHLTNLLKALANDPDLAHINPTELPQILQTLYVCTGCDYTSFFSRVGKATFLRYFFQHASFITSTCTAEATRGTLANVGLENSDFEKGFLAFTRLVGTAYFKLHSSSFQCTSPATHFMSLFNKELTVQEHHSKWLESIRQAIWYRVKFENEEIPSDDALMLHWKRSCWIMHMWQQSDQSAMILQPMQNYGWVIKNGILSILWDSDINIQTIHDRVDALLSGCKCSTGCSSKRCGCLKKLKYCSVGCQCISCCNIPDNGQHTRTDTTIPLLEDLEAGHLSDREDEDICDLIYTQTNTYLEDSDTEDNC